MRRVPLALLIAGAAAARVCVRTQIPGPLSRRQAILGAAAAAAVPWRAAASQEQEPANLSFSSDETDAVARNQMSGGGGPALYDEVARSQVRARTDAAAERWRKMIGDVVKALDRTTPAYPVAQSALDNNMNALKADMRAVSKELSGGDITVGYVSPGGVQQPVFDYNSGQFKLQPLAEQCEAVFTAVNAVYFDAIKRRAPAPVALEGVAAADKLFAAWLAQVQQQPQTANASAK